MTHEETPENIISPEIQDELVKIKQEQEVLKKNFKEIYTTYDFSLELLNDALITIEDHAKPPYFEWLAIMFYTSLLLGVLDIFSTLITQNRYIYTSLTLIFCSFEVIFLIVLALTIFKLEEVI